MSRAENGKDEEGCVGSGEWGVEARGENSRGVTGSDGVWVGMGGWIERNGVSEGVGEE